MTEISNSPPVPRFPPGQDTAATEQQPATAPALTMLTAATSSTRAKDHPAARGYLKPRELAALLRVSPMTIYRLIRGGKLEAIRVGRSYRIPESAARCYLTSGQPGSGNAATTGTGTLPGNRPGRREGASPDSCTRWPAPGARGGNPGPDCRWPATRQRR
jgi:excisionase family DNA binding protein